MSMKAIKDIYAVQVSLAASVRTASANGTAIDFANVIENMIVIQPGAITDGTHTPKIQDSPDGTTWTDCPAGYLVGTLAAIAANTVQKISYIGPNRYGRVVATVTGATNGGAYTAYALTRPRKQPA